MIGSRFQKLEEQRVAMEMHDNKKVFWLICTWMDSHCGSVAHTVPFCSIVIVLLLKKIMIYHDGSIILVDQMTSTFSASGTSSERSTMQFLIWSIIKLAFWFPVLWAQVLTCQADIMPISLFAELTKWPLGHVTFTYHLLNICTLCQVISAQN